MKQSCVLYMFYCVLILCKGNPLVTGGFLIQGPVMRRLYILLLLARASCSTKSQIAIDFRCLDTNVVSLQCSYICISLLSSLNHLICKSYNIPDSKVHGANMGPIWGWQDPDWPHIGPINLAVWDFIESTRHNFRWDLLLENNASLIII